MYQNKKNSKTPSDRMTVVAQNSGLLLMALAATIGMIELPEHPNGKVVVPNQAVSVYSNAGGSGEENTLRREREEAGPHYVSYSVAQRTPGRTGRI